MSEEEKEDLSAQIQKLSGVLKEFEDKHGELKPVLGTLPKPITVKVVDQRKKPGRSEGVGNFVSVRPVGDEKTYLGILLGDMEAFASTQYSAKSETLFVMHSTNPAIWVPDLNRVVRGYESWWSPIKSEEHLREITNDDIDNIWYVKALKSLEQE